MSDTYNHTLPHDAYYPFFSFAYFWETYANTPCYGSTPHYIKRRTYNNDASKSIYLVPKPPDMPRNIDRQETMRITAGKVKLQKEKEERSIFTGLPYVQILMLIPLSTFLFRRQKPGFNFARLASMFFVFPATLLLIYFALL